MSEQWKPVVGYEDRYEVSDLGRIRAIFDGGWQHFYKAGRIKKPTVARNGYLVINLCKPPKPRGKQHYVHRLVIEAFIGPIPEGSETRHLDGNRTNPKLSNLAIGTCFDNQEDKRRHGTRYYKMTEKVLERVRLLHSEGLGVCAIAPIVGVTRQTVSAALKR